MNHLLTLDQFSTPDDCGLISGFNRPPQTDQRFTVQPNGFRKLQRNAAANRLRHHLRPSPTLEPIGRLVLRQLGTKVTWRKAGDVAAMLVCVCVCAGISQVWLSAVCGEAPIHVMWPRTRCRGNDGGLWDVTSGSVRRRRWCRLGLVASSRVWTAALTSAELAEVLMCRYQLPVGWSLWLWSDGPIPFLSLARVV